MPADVLPTRIFLPLFRCRSHNRDLSYTSIGTYRCSPAAKRVEQDCNFGSKIEHATQRTTTLPRCGRLSAYHPQSSLPKHSNRNPTTLSCDQVGTTKTFTQIKWVTCSCGRPIHRLSTPSWPSRRIK